MEEVDGSKYLYTVRQPEMGGDEQLHQLYCVTGNICQYFIINTM